MKVNFRTKRNVLMKMIETHLPKSRQSNQLDDTPHELYNGGKSAENFERKVSQLFNVDQQLVNMHNTYELEPRDRKVIIPFDFKDTQLFIFEKQQLKLDEWLGEMYSAVVSSSFQLFLKNQLSYEEVKVYCSQNLLLNILLFLDKANDFETIEIMKHINQRLKDNLGYLLTKYPQAKEIKPNKKLRSAITSINNIGNDENDMVLISKVKFALNPTGDYTSEIMQFINFLISLPTQECNFRGKRVSYFQAFNEVMEKIFEWVQYPETVYNEDYMFQNLIEEESKSEVKRKQSATYSQRLIENYQQNFQQEQYIEEPCEEEEDVHYKFKKGGGKIKEKKDLFADQNIMDQKQLKEFQQKVKKYTNYKIGIKINPNTQLFKNHQLQQGRFKIKSTAILRVLTKWTEELSQKILNSREEILMRSFRFKSKIGNFIKLNASQKNNLYQGALKEVEGINQFLRNISQECIGIEASLSKRIQKNKKMYHIPKHQYMVGEFCSKLESAASTYLLNYLNKNIDVLLKIPEISLEDAQKRDSTNIKSKDVNLITFKTGDLMRCKCSSHEDQILRIFNLLKRISDSESNLLKIIRIKDRLELGTRDILINIIFMNKILCEIQLAVTEAVDFKQTKYDAFNHYLYQLKRSTLGSIMQSACIWAHLDQRSKNFKTRYQALNQCPNLNINFRKHLCSRQYMTNYQYSYVCSLCGNFYSSPVGIIKPQKCKHCRKYYECRNCIENRMNQNQLKQYLKLMDGHMKIFQKDFQRWIPTTQGVFPDFCVLIPKRHKKIIYFFTQKITLKGVSYILHLTESQDSSQPNINIITSFKVDDFNDLIKIHEGFFVYEWTERRKINKTLPAENQIQILRKQEEREEELHKLRNQKRQTIKKKVKNNQRTKWQHTNIVEEQSSSQEDQENQAAKMRRERKKKKRQKIAENNQKQDRNVRRMMRNAINVGLNKKQSKIQSRPSSARSGKSKTSGGATRKAERMKMLNEAENVEFIQIFGKRNDKSELRISQKSHNGSRYMLILGFYLRQGELKVFIKKKLNQAAVREMYENKTQVIFLEEEKIDKQLSLGMSDFFRFAPGLRNITEIYLDENRIKDMSFVKDFLKLQIFHANHNWISDMSPIKGLQNLTQIMLSNNKISEIQGLDNKQKLTILTLTKNLIYKIQNLENLESLKELQLCTNQISKIQGLETLTELTKLDLFINQIQKIEGLQNLTKLQILFLGGNKISVMEGLENQLYLKQLNLNYNKLIEKIQNINHCKELETLSLYSNKIKKIQNIENLEKLSNLVLGRNLIQKIQNMKNLHKLHHLNLQNNKIANFYDYEQVENLYDLQHLNIGANHLRFIDHDILQFLPKVQFLNIVNNPIKRTNLSNRKSITEIKDSMNSFSFKL